MIRYGNPRRTQANQTQAAISFIYGARPEMVEGKTADQICATWGVTGKAGRERVVEALAKRARP